MARALRAWAINRGGKNSVRNLRNGPRTRLVRGMYVTMPICLSVLFSGIGGDSFSGHRCSPFTTKDQDNDSYSSNCAVSFMSSLVVHFLSWLQPERSVSSRTTLVRG